MSSILPIITMSDLQRRAKQVLSAIEDYAVIQSHGKDRAFLLSPRLGRVLVETGMLERLQQKCVEYERSHGTLAEMDALIGEVLSELSKK